MNSERIQRCHLTAFFFPEGRGFLRVSQVSGQALIDLLNHAKENGALAGVKKMLGDLFKVHVPWTPKTIQNLHV